MANPTFTAARNGADTAAARNGSATHGPAGTGRTVDWNGYPALFQRVAPESRVADRTNETIQSPAGPAPVIGTTGGIRDAFLGFCQAALFAPAPARYFDRPSETVAAARAIAAAEAFGFTRDEIRGLGCGLYVGPAAIREDLRGVGFVDAEIDAARLVSDDAGRPRAELAGSLLVPLTDETGHLSDFLLLSVAENGRTFSGYRFLTGPSKSSIVVYGLQTALSRPSGRDSLVIVDDVFEGLFLQCRGLPNATAIGASGRELTPRRWEELARLGVTTVTLAFRQDESHSADVRSALVNALRAKTAPQVFVADSYPGGERSLASVLRRFGKEACTAALAARSLAFHDKDFGAPDRMRSEPASPPPAVHHRPSHDRSSHDVDRPAPARPDEKHHRAAYRQHLADLAASLPAEDREIAQRVIEQVAAAIVAGDFVRAAWLTQAASCDGSSGWTSPIGWTTPHYGPGFSAWNTGVGSAWSYEPSWLRRTVEEPAALSSASISPAGVVLDRLTKSSHPVAIPSHMTGYAGRERPSSIEWAIDGSARGRLATLCERVVDACERRPDQSFLIACCEHSEQQILLTLATHLASRISEGDGLTIEEVQTRFAHREPAEGFRDKPWLADEAADRLRLWSPRLTFVTCPPTDAGKTAIDQAIEMVRAKSTIGGVFFDALPGAGGVPAAGCLGWLDDVASRCGGQVFAAASAPPVVLTSTVPAWPVPAWPAPAWSMPAWPMQAWSTPTAPLPAWSMPALSVPSWSANTSSIPATPAWWSLPRTDGGRAVLATLREWLQRESGSTAAA